jgi:hypothetical protein
VSTHTKAPSSPPVKERVLTSWKPVAEANRQPEIHSADTPQIHEGVDGSDVHLPPDSVALKLGASAPAREKPPVENQAASEHQAGGVSAMARETQPAIASSQATTSRVSMASIPHVILRMTSDLEQKTQSVRLRLDPPRLGEVSVDLKLGENGLTLRIVSQTPEARDLLQQDLPRLQDLLKASGLNLQLFSASCDLSGERPERQAPPAFERASRTGLNSPDTLQNPVTILSRQYETSVRINAHA